jgi:hypothetical protein
MRLALRFYPHSPSRGKGQCLRSMPTRFPAIFRRLRLESQYAVSE